MLTAIVCFAFLTYQPKVANIRDFTDINPEERSGLVLALNTLPLAGVFLVMVGDLLRKETKS